MVIYQNNRNSFHPELIRILESSCYDMVVKQVYTFIDKIHAYRYKYIFRVKP